MPEVDVEVRLVPFAPQMKLYILNRRLALQGFYVTEEGAIPLPPDREEWWLTTTCTQVTHSSTPQDVAGSWTWSTPASPHPWRELMGPDEGERFSVRWDDARSAIANQMASGQRSSSGWLSLDP
ncbi:hypothetical protein ACFYWN_42390 [Streptomyces sp. NPDC002917]|uniref:hypothetical protein n=1 Tax=Streptomyces sp. NPDC002917 TaxID=3364671 RepID=UPI003680BFFF